MVEAQVLAAWLTPTSLFVLLNIVLATIFLNHNSKNNNKHHDTATATAAHSQSHPQLIRAPSLFSRVASFNFSHYYHSEDSHVAPQPDTTAAATVTVATPPAVETITRAPSLLYRVASFKLGWTSPAQQVDGEGKTVNEQEEEARESDVRKEKVEEEEVKVVNKKVVRKKKVVAEVEKKTTAFKKEDEEVDSKADDFINKFKQQLKLQRLESLLRYRNNNA